MGRGRFRLLQLLLNFRHLALKAALFSRVFLHQGLVLLFRQQTWNEILIKTSNQAVKLVQSAIDCLKFILLLLWLTIRLCFPFAFQFFRKATLICDNVAWKALDRTQHQLIEDFVADMMDGAVHGSVSVAAASERVIGFSAFVVIRLIGHLTAAISAIHKTRQ